MPVTVDRYMLMGLGKHEYMESLKTNSFKISDGAGTSYLLALIVSFTVTVKFC